MHIGDEGLVFVQPGETDHVLYIGVFNKTGGNTGDNTGGNTGDKAGDNTGGKVGGETNVIVLDAGGELIDNILIAAWPSYLRDDEGLIRVLRNGHPDMYQCDSHCRRVPRWVPAPPGPPPPGTARPISTNGRISRTGG